MAQVSCARLLQLLRGTGKPGQSMPVQGTCASPLGDSCPSPKFRPPDFASLSSLDVWGGNQLLTVKTSGLLFNFSVGWNFGEAHVCKSRSLTKRGLSFFQASRFAAPP